MDRRKYILRRLEKELHSLGYEDPFLYRDGESFIAAIFPMNEETEDEFYTVQISWIVDDENDRILFRGERVLQEVCDDDGAELLHFCNEWNKNGCTEQLFIIKITAACIWITPCLCRNG